MKKVLFVLSMVTMMLILSSNENGRLSRSGQASTTAPGENQSFCGSIGCHFGSNFNADVNVALHNVNGEAVNKYIPGENYMVSIKVNHTGTPAGYGFQIVSLKDSDDSAINNFFDIPGFAQESAFMNRQYVEQNTTVGMDSIVLNWTAPEAGSGDVTFYAAGNAVDGNGSPSNDSGDSTRMTITEDIMSSLAETTLGFDLKIYPNPVNNYMTLSSQTKINRIEILNTNGQLIQTIAFENRVDVSSLDSGVYIMNAISNEGKVQTQKVVKL